MIFCKPDIYCFILIKSLNSESCSLSLVLESGRVNFFFHMTILIPQLLAGSRLLILPRLIAHPQRLRS